MYLACRHIKPNGVRCESPALCGHAFCYFHARLHTKSNITVLSDLKLPVPEDNAAIQESLAKVFEAILNSRISSKEAAQILWGLQIATQTIPRKPAPPPKSVESLTRTRDGDELAPVLNVCLPGRECKDCKDAETCPRYFDLDEFFGNSKAAPDEQADDDENESDENVPPKDDANERDHGEQYLVREDYLREWDDDNDDDDEDDKEDGKALLNTLFTLRSLKESLEIED